MVKEDKTMSRSACLGVAGLYLAALLAFLPFAPPVAAQSPDTALVNGNIITLDEHSTVAEALAVRDGKIVAVGRSVDIRDLAGPATRVIDLGGHTVIPGLIDSHMHAIRAALFYATEVNWIGTRSIAEAMARIAAAARAARPGQWIIVAGGWTEQQFAEGRRPTQAELVAAAPDHPVYIQLFYSAALLNPAGFKALNLINDSDVPPRGKIERDATGNPTGWISGDNPTITALFDRLPLPSFDESVAGTRQFGRELSAAVQGLAGPRTDRARHLQPVRATPRQGAGGLPEPHPDAAHGLRRRHAALQRHRRERDLGHVQQRQPYRSPEAAILRNRQMGGVARHDLDAALEQRRLGPPSARRVRAREPRHTDCGA